MTYLVRLKGVRAPDGAERIDIPPQTELDLFDMPGLVDWRRPSPNYMAGGKWHDEHRRTGLEVVNGTSVPPFVSAGPLNGQPCLNKDAVLIFSTPAPNSIIPAEGFTLVWVGAPSASQVTHQPIFCSRNDGGYLRIGHSPDGQQIRFWLGNGPDATLHEYGAVPTDRCFMASYDSQNQVVQLFDNTALVSEMSVSSQTLANRWLHLFGTMGDGTLAASFRGNIYDLMVIDGALHNDPARLRIVNDYLIERYDVG